MRIKDAMKFLIENRTGTSTLNGSDAAWHEHEDSLNFLADTTSGDVPIYIGGTNFYLYSLSVPADVMQGDYVDDIGRWNFSPTSGYGYSCSWPDGKPKFQLEGPISQTGSKILDNGTAFFFLRQPWGRDDLNRLEINQQVCHILDLHWVAEKRSWCKLNNLGEVVPIARWEIKDSVNYVTMQRDELDDYLFLAKACLIRVFDVSRSRDFTLALGAGRHKRLIRRPEIEIYAERILFGEPSKPLASQLRGFQIIKADEQGAASRLTGTEARQYERFLIQDWKHSQIKEWSADPKQLGNYFVDSDLPYEASPVFFKAEVLARYQQDPARFKIGDRRIECRGAWSLQYDINDEGQVHTFICYLGQLPHQEQQYWKPFNEPPKAPISERSFRTDFEGQWDLSHDPLRSIKSTISSFPKTDESGRACPVWQIPNLSETHDLDTLSYVRTDSLLEWELQISRLAQITVEGLNADYINRIAEKLGVRDQNLKSGKQLACVLNKIGLAEQDVNDITQPFAELWEVRSKKVAHPGKNLTPFDTKKHFRELIEKCDRAMKALSKLVSTGRLVIP